MQVAGKRSVKCVYGHSAWGVLADHVSYLPSAPRLHTLHRIRAVARAAQGQGGRHNLKTTRLAIHRWDRWQRNTLDCGLAVQRVSRRFAAGCCASRVNRAGIGSRAIG